MSDKNIMTEFINELATAVAAKLTIQSPVAEDKDTDNYFTVADVCKKYKISKATFYRHQNYGFIKPAFYVGRKPLYDQQSIRDYLNNFKAE